MQRSYWFKHDGVDFLSLCLFSFHRVESHQLKTQIFKFNKGPFCAVPGLLPICCTARQNVWCMTWKTIIWLPSRSASAHWKCCTGKQFSKTFHENKLAWREMQESTFICSIFSNNFLTDLFFLARPRCNMWLQKFFMINLIFLLGFYRCSMFRFKRDKSWNRSDFSRCKISYSNLRLILIQASFYHAEEPTGPENTKTHRNLADIEINFGVSLIPHSFVHGKGIVIYVLQSFFREFIRSVILSFYGAIF